MQRRVRPRVIEPSPVPCLHEGKWPLRTSFMPQIVRPSLKLPQWNPDGLKMGLCRVPPLGASSAVLCLKNSPAIAQNFDTLKNRFNKLYQVKAMLHHYTQVVDATVFEDAINDLEDVIECYKNADLNAPNFHV